MTEFSFGVGSFSLRLIPDAVPTHLTLDEYATRVVEGLGRLPNIGNIEMEVDQDFPGSYTFDATPPPLNSPDGEFLFPLRDVPRIKFDLHIPERVRTDVGEKHGWFWMDQFTTETFTVHLRGEYHAPVTFVDFRDESMRLSGAASVMLVREHLKEQLNTLSPNLVLDSLGPSPFHADFVAQSGDEGTALIQEWRVTRGYDQVQVAFPESVEDPKEYVYSALADEFAAFYLTEHLHNKVWMEWTSVRGATDTLVTQKVAEQDSLKRFWPWPSGSLSEKAMLRLTRFEVMRSGIALDCSKTLEEVRPIAWAGTVTDRIESTIADLQDWPTQPTRDLIDLFRSQYIRRLNIAMLLISAVVGGIIGGLITLIATA